MARAYAIVKEGYATKEKKGTSAAGRPYHFLEQEVFVENSRGERKLMRVTVDPGKEYPAGEYDLDLNHIGFIRDQKGFEQVGFVRLALTPRVPVKA